MSENYFYATETMPDIFDLGTVNYVTHSNITFDEVEYHMIKVVQATSNEVTLELKRIGKDEHETKRYKNDE